MSTDDYQNFTRGEYLGKAASIAAGLRRLADDVERQAREVRDRIANGPAADQSPHSYAASRVQHEVLWGLANLDLPGLTKAAAEADAAAALTERGQS